MEKKELKKTVTLRMDVEMQRQLKIYSATEGKTVMEVIEDMITKTLGLNGGNN